MRRRLILLTSVVLGIIIVAIGIIFLVNRSPRLQNTIEKVANLNSNSSVTTNTNSPTNTNTPVVSADAASINTLARNFSEVYGSGSNDDGFSNLITAGDYGTTAFRAFVQKSLNDLSKEPTTAPYHGYVTTALVIDVTKQAATTAKVIVTTQRTGTTDRQEQTYYQKLQLDLVKEAGTWKVGGAFWQPRT